MPEQRKSYWITRKTSPAFPFLRGPSILTRRRTTKNFSRKIWECDVTANGEHQITREKDSSHRLPFVKSYISKIKRYI